MISKSERRHVLLAAAFVLLALPAIRGDEPLPGMLYPKESEFREVKSLDGMWRFRTAPVGELTRGYEGRWLDGKRGLGDVPGVGPIIDMPVPSSFNDITTNATLRDYNGWAWYDLAWFYVPASWSRDTRVVLRFGSAHYYAKVWVNGIEAMSHIGGHLPFEADVTSLLNYGPGGRNELTVAINNTLTPHTIPQGTVTFPKDPDRKKKKRRRKPYPWTRYPPGYVSYSNTFDFFNYAGIHRPVMLYTTPLSYIEDINVNTILQDGTAFVEYDVTAKPDSNSVSPVLDCTVELLYGNYYDGRQPVGGKGCAGTLEVPDPILWWPRTMHPQPGYLYTFEVRLWMNGTLVDIYRQPVGLRMITWNETSFLINGEPVYLRGFGRHEDSDIRGKGLDLPLVTRDHNLLSWVGANSYRTSHYPYAEEIMDFADRLGFLIVDECPAVNLDNYDDELLERHKAVMSELVRRDKNRPSVVMWSIANEPRSQKIAAGPYFRSVVEYVKTLDNTRPLTAAINQGYKVDNLAQYLDIIGVNRYYSWYSDTGHLELVQHQVESEITRWNQKFNKPVFMTEYGADAVSGLHTLPESVWTEDYQVALMREYFKAFDNLRSKGFFIGEMIWNFADFATGQGITRVVGNKKGVFTRSRQPKSSARFLKERYWCLANHNSSTSCCLY
ncbi:beta-glucuronidase-like isoform X2 [Ischnura elegans]|uniref:beta-glucuronidase-like isoform X2 n=1 Tax=Ischnura elegans TaxID=197161 RepID=UPI001ED8B115|nr:beta-glucuronidase-like isoform X2 [Ischnura elegans]